ncbi:MAG: hypothetical protein WA322_25945 [Pseudolabrys sp.]
MLNLTPVVPDKDVTVHIVLNDFGDLGRAYVEGAGSHPFIIGCWALHLLT